MPELLIELFSEEIPARMQARAAEDLCKALHKELGALMPVAPRGYSGPRRLAVVGEMAARAETAPKEERGPRVGAPDAALDGFLRKHGAARDALVQEGQFWVLKKPGEVLEAADLLARALPAVLRNFPWPKSMRWGTSPFLWVRPLQRVVCILGGEVLRFPMEHGVVSGDETEGHRVLAPGAFRVTGFADYVAGLRERKVVLDAAERVALIRDGVAALAAAEGLEVVPDEGLLAEVSGLVEWPVPLLGRIDDAFMDLPPEVMRTTMRINQKYFALRNKDGKAAPRFALVANITATDGGKALVAGNERVLRARLSDARFFWDLDRKQKLEDYLPKLDSVVYHAKLGTQGERVERLVRLAGVIAPLVGADVAQAERAAGLAKADLATGMVGEFPELQGVMGRYYALGQGEAPAVAEAVAEHYRPLGAGDAVPSDPVAVSVALADKLDQLAGFFAVGEKPTGSGDPYALRRAALGVIRIVRENGLRVGLAAVIEEHHSLHIWDMARRQQEEIRKAKEELGKARGVADDGPTMGIFNASPANVVVKEVLDFLFDRLRVQLRAEGARHDVVAAILGTSPDDDLTRLLARADALRSLVESEDGANLLAAYRRAANILRIEEKKDAASYTATELNPADLTLPEEVALSAALNRAAPEAARLLAAEDFSAAMAALATLRAPLDAFFEKVLVNEPQFRRNRLALLARLRAAMDSVADLSKLEG
jgi:glycyl-tRNA synthetase beta chain